MATKKADGERVRLRIKLSGVNSKVFTTEGPAVNGSVVELPSGEAQALCDRDQAVLTGDELKAIDPITYVEDNPKDVTRPQ